jgi:Uncharacterized protein related to plant photosystem II stability/assembly factor
VFYNSHVRAPILLIAIFIATIQALCGQLRNAEHDTNLRGVSATHSFGNRRRIIWASGSNGVILRSTDDGVTWKQLAVSGAPDLDFRGIVAFGEKTAYVMSSGSGEKSRIYKTNDGGVNWRLQYSDRRTGFFLDSLACESETRCVALSDPVDGKFVILRTSDGSHWKELPFDKMPPTLPNEGAFAASNSSLVICDRGKNIYFGTGGGNRARLFHSEDGGLSWMAPDTPIESGTASSGVFSLACSGSLVMAVGGDYKDVGKSSKTAAYSTDFGASWSLTSPSPGGYRSVVFKLSAREFFTAGPNGADTCRLQDGKRMGCVHAGNLNLNAVSFFGKRGWAVGQKGSIYEVSGIRDPVVRH